MSYLSQCDEPVCSPYIRESEARVEEEILSPKTETDTITSSLSAGALPQDVGTDQLPDLLGDRTPTLSLPRLPAGYGGLLSLLLTSVLSHSGRPPSALAVRSASGSSAKARMLAALSKGL